MGEIQIEDYIVEWDDEKNRKNFRKHGIYFEDSFEHLGVKILKKSSTQINYFYEDDLNKIILQI